MRRDPRDQRLDVQHPRVVILHLLGIDVHWSFLLVRREECFTTAFIHECDGVDTTADLSLMIEENVKKKLESKEPRTPVESWKTPGFEKRITTVLLQILHMTSKLLETRDSYSVKQSRKIILSEDYLNSYTDIN
jgi:hypothetical protein